LMKISSLGSPLWVMRYYLWSPEFVRPQIDYNNNIYLAGWFVDTANFSGDSYLCLLKTSQTGIPLKCSYDTLYDSYSGAAAYDLLVQGNGTCIVSGDLGNKASFITKFNSNGNPIWSYKYDKMDSLLISNLSFGLDSSIIGYGWNFIQKSPYLNTNFAMVKVNANGNDGCNDTSSFNLIHHLISYQSTSVNISTPIINTKNVLLNFSPNVIDTFTTCAGKVIVGAGINEITTSNKVEVFPNPSNGVFTIQSPVVSQKLLVKIYNMLGQEVASSNSSKGGEFKSLPSGGLGWAIDISNHPSGIYLYRVTNSEGALVGSGKLVIN
jgi:hypothetical protein